MRRRLPRHLARAVHILDAQQPAAAAGARVEIARRRRVERPQMQIARRRGGESSDIARPARRGILAVSVVAVAVLLFAALAPLLRLDGQRGDRPRLEALDADLLAGLEAIAV